MSYRPSDSSKKPKKKSKKLKPRKKTKNPKSLDECSTNYSEDVNHPSSVTTSVNSAIIKWNQEQPRESDPYENGDYSKMPHEAPNEVNFVGGIGGNIGHRRSKSFIDRTTTIQQIYNMRCANRTVFNFCENPQLTSNVPPREKSDDEQDGDKLAKNTARQIGAIKHEQLPVQLPSDQCTRIEQDPEHLDTKLDTDEDQTIDNKQINLEIRKQYLDQKRILLKQKLETEVPNRLEDEYRKEKFKLSEYFDIYDIPEDIPEVEVDWSEKYKVEAHSCDLKFARPMPEVIPMPLQTEKLAFLTKTLDKPQNIEKLNRELQKRSEPLEENVTKDFSYRETARELNKILRKQKAENLSIELALKDFDEFMKNSTVFNIVDDDAMKENTNSTEESRRGNIQSAIKDYEEKILHQLSESDGTSSARNTSDEVLESPRNDEEDHRRSVSTQENELPIDFTFPFDTRRNRVTCTDLKKNNRKEAIHSLEESAKQESDNKRSINNKDKVNKNSKKPIVKKTESFCTNFTDDSGSFIVALGKQLHLDRIKSTKKSTKVTTEKPTETFDEYLRPYEVLPLKEAKKLNQKDPKLVPTFDIKDRLKVDVPQFDTELIGVKNEKYLSQLATEWDEYYQKEILNRPRIRRFKPRTIMKQIVDSLRLKYESMHKREYLTEKTIIIEQEKMFTKRAEQFRDFCTAFFSNLTTTNYRQSMAKIQDLRPMYELNDELTFELTSLQNELIQLKTAIIRTEGKAREATILQNVSYLMKDSSWRERNDWIHKRPDGRLETIKESIENRMTTNLRKRDNDSVWAIKEFFENNVFNNKRPALVCFESPHAIIETIVDFKIQLYLSLLKLDLSTWTLMNLTHAYNSYVKWSTDFIQNRKKYVEARCAKKYFLDVCAANMKKDAVDLINGKLVETISEKTRRTLEPLCNALFVNVIPINIQEQSGGSDVLSKFRLIISHAMNMLEKIDTIPSAKRKEIEKNIRKDNGFIQRRTKRAVDLEAHIDKVRKVMLKHSNPPFRRLPRIGKLPRSYLETTKPQTEQKGEQTDDGYETVRLTITEKDFESLQESSTPNEFYLDAQFFGGDPEVPNMDFLPEMKSNINEFIVDIKELLDKWEQNKQERYMEDAHNAWVASFAENSNG